MIFAVLVKGYEQNARPTRVIKRGTVRPHQGRLQIPSHLYVGIRESIDLL